MTKARHRTNVSVALAACVALLATFVVPSSVASAAGAPSVDLLRSWGAVDSAVRVVGTCDSSHLSRGELSWAGAYDTPDGSKYPRKMTKRVTLRGDGGFLSTVTVPRLGDGSKPAPGTDFYLILRCYDAAGNSTYADSGSSYPFVVTRSLVTGCSRVTSSSVDVARTAVQVRVAAPVSTLESRAFTVTVRVRNTMKRIWSGKVGFVVSPAVDAPVSQPRMQRVSTAGRTVTPTCVRPSAGVSLPVYRTKVKVKAGSTRIVRFRVLAGHGQTYSLQISAIRGRTGLQGSGTFTFVEFSGW